MDRATRSRIEDWDARPVSGGFAGLADLADAEFTGAVVAGGAHLFMLNGRVVGVVGGSMSTFEGADATAHVAPDPALPLLFAMRARGGDVRGKYYTDDTPLREVDSTLTEGGFTGFLELSENVLSGDYYVVYYGGRSLAAAFVGNEGRVVTGEEAFELAADEVGIYEVRSVDLDVEDVPEPPEDASGGAEGAGVGGAGAAAGAAGAAETADEPGEEGGDETTTHVGAPGEAGPDDGPAAEDVGEEPDATTADEPEPDVGDDEGAVADVAGEESAEADAEDTAPTADEADDEGATDDAGAAAAAGSVPGTDDDADEDAPPGIEEAEPDASGGAARAETETDTGPAAGSTSPRPSADETPNRAASAGAGRTTADARTGEASEPDERFREEERWREARTVPALDPEDTELPPAPEAEPARPQPEPATREAPTEEASAREGEPEALRERVAELESELEATERERRRTAERAEELADERDALEEERAALEARVEELEAKIEEQEERLAAQEEEIAAQASAPAGSAGTGTAGREAIGEGKALDQTDLFVRYRSKGEATLQTAHDGRADRDDVGENLRLETHSRFDPAGVSVDGRPFEEYLADTIEYRFVAWLVEDLLYEIRGTGTERSLRALYDALPQIDRAEFGGTVTGVDEDGNEREETFDVVCRDRMGKPLVVANINDSLDPATGEMMGGLVEDATAAAEPHESIGAAFLVTASFFEPDALETASDATGGGFLSRDSKKSFVKLSRKGGYHLCLVEARGGDFHVAVPEL